MNPKPTIAPGAKYALFVLFAINLINFFDRQIIGGIGEAIRREWGLNDTMLGALGTAFTLLYAVVGVPLGRFADRSVRKNILAAGVFVWSALTAASGLARNFGQLFIVRLGVGVGEATCSPASTSLIGDYFPATMRARAMSIFMLGLPIGLGVSSYIGARIAEAWGWRAAFFIAGIPGILCAIAALAMREPERGMAEARHVGTRRREGSPYRLVLSIPTVWWIIASGALHNFNMYAFGAFLSPYLIRFHKVSLSDAGLIVMFVYGFSGIAGLLGGGMAADALYRKRIDGRLLVSTLAIAISTPLLYLALTRGSGDVMGFALLMGIGIGVMYAYYSCVYSTLQDVVEPALRGTAMALYFCAMYFLGASLGPLGTGVASDYFTFRAAAAAGVGTERSIMELLVDLLPTMVGQSKLGVTPAVEPFRAAGLRSAMYLIPLLSALLFLVLFAASRTVKKDVERLQAWMQRETAEVPGRHHS